MTSAGTLNFRVAMAEKRKRCSLSVAEKRKIINYVNENPLMKKIDIAKKFEIPSSTLATILKSKERFSEESGFRANSKRLKLCEYTDVEKCLLTWLKQCRDKNVAIGGPILQEKAQQFAVELGHAEFRASNGWLHNFKKRNEIIFRKICGESAEVNEEVCDEWRNKLETQSEGYDPENIFNIDETGLFYKCLPDKTLSFKGDKCHGGKNSKLRLTVLLGTNCTGTYKLKPLVIGKYKKPRCFKNVENLPTDYTSNTKAWMTCDVFNNWLRSLDKEIKKKKRKILIFVDNCTAHGDIPPLTNIKIKYLPANTTSKLQPLDQGIIQSFKMHYRKEVVRRYLADIEHQSPTLIDVLQAMWMITKAWNQVTEKTIQNCFKKSGFRVPDEDENDDLPSGNFNFQEPNFEEFVTFDDDVAVCGELTDADIVASVLPVATEETEEGEEDEDKTNQIDFTITDAQNALNVIKYVFLKKGGLSDSVVKSITELDCALDITNPGKQTTIYDYFSSKDTKNDD